MFGKLSPPGLQMGIFLLYTYMKKVRNFSYHESPASMTSSNPNHLPVTLLQTPSHWKLGLSIGILGEHSLWLLSIDIIHMVFSSGASGKEPSYQCSRYKRCEFNPWVGKIPWRRKWKPTALFFPGESHEQRSLEGYSL